jgi:hypothetical protein
MSSLCSSDLPVYGHTTALTISGMMTICLFYVGCAIIGVLDGIIWREKGDLLVVSFHRACTVTG